MHIVTLGFQVCEPRMKSLFSCFLLAQQCMFGHQTFYKIARSTALTKYKNFSNLLINPIHSSLS